MRQKIPLLIILFLAPCLIPIGRASSVRASGQRRHCPRLTLAEELLLELRQEDSSSWVFPTSNRLYQSNSSWWKTAKDPDTLVHSTAAIPPHIKAVLFFYYSPSCPFSTALRPVMECLPKFFPPSVIFFAMDITSLPTNMVLNNGIMATPRVRLLRKEQDAVAEITAIKECGNATECTCAQKALPVVAADIVQLGNNRWMLLACLFLVGVGAYSTGFWPNVGF